ncbi:MAG: peptide chain release factor N(5)-glutamine methyltransferase [Bacteroidales bacterium]|nr:peptide chain release factor N(5)-glutamine methyltransferase [Bacteroidales bacterium]
MKVPSNLVRDIRKYYCEQLCSVYDNDEANAMILILLEHYFNITRIKMALEPELRLSESEMLTFHFAVKDLLKNKPIQYIIGETEFCDLKFKVNENVLIPRPETSELVMKIINSQQPTANSQQLILDIGTGSGCIAISLAKQIPNSKVYALDISEKALEVAKGNAINNDTDVTFIHDDILNLKNNIDTKFDIIVSNPPYVRELEKAEMRDNVLDWEPHNALFVSDSDPLIFYRNILEFAKTYLNQDGEIWFEINEYLGKEMTDLCKEYGFSDVEIFKDFRGKERALKTTRLQDYKTTSRERSY